MKKVLLLTTLILLIATLAVFFYFKKGGHFVPPATAIDNTTSVANVNQELLNTTTEPLNKIKQMLRQQAPALNKQVIHTVLTALKCAKENEIEHNNILTIIDFSLPSNKKRLWVFDLAQHELLFHTYVSHGIKSGTLLSNYFSNKSNSKASSIGVFNTEKSYVGRHGTALKLQGLDKGFNDNAYNRFIVMHGSWYVNEEFIKKYGRAGRSWGCPTLPLSLTKPIINTIKDNALLIAYYPGDNWFLKSKFLNCDAFSGQDTNNLNIETTALEKEEEQRGDILFADLNNNDKREENEPIVVMSANSYKHIFNTRVPLKRMLRRQINNTEYVALSNEEFKKLITDNQRIDNNNPKGLDTIYFVIPVVKMLRGYYATEMKMVTLGKIEKIELNTGEHHTIHLKEKSPATLKTTKRFIRWLGL